MEARDLTEVGMRMGWLLSWRQVAVETAHFPDRQTGTPRLTAEYVNINRACGYEMAETTPTHTHTQGNIEEWYR